MSFVASLITKMVGNGEIQPKGPNKSAIATDYIEYIYEYIPITPMNESCIIVSWKFGNVSFFFMKILSQLYIHYSHHIYEELLISSPIM